MKSWRLDAPAAELRPRLSGTAQRARTRHDMREAVQAGGTAFQNRLDEVSQQAAQQAKKQGERYRALLRAKKS